MEEDHAVIGIGGTVHMGLQVGPRKMNRVKNELFSEIFRRFPTINAHWLGGSSKIVHKYPFFSIDSAGYLQGRKKNQMYYFDGVDISTKIANNMSPIDCLVHNIKLLAKLEGSTNPLLAG